MANEISKITNSHLDRLGYVYIRQSTQYQVDNNQESTLRQYAMKQTLIKLGWESDRIVVIDEDLGLSGKTTAERKGFQRLMADLVNEKIGAIAILEVSRLSRSSSDWARLVEVCVMTDTLLIDAEGIYDPKEFNDGLVLDLKGTISAAELHYLRERMRGGLLNKARRGELVYYLPIGYESDYDGKIVKTPDLNIQEAVNQLFELFREFKTAYGVTCYFDEHDMTFPFRVRKKGRPSEIIWTPLNEERAVNILHNPFYAGRYVFGRTQVQWMRGARRPRQVPEEKWHANIPNHHEAYISEEEFQVNQIILAQNCQQFASDGDNERKTAPREGDGLLQGIVYCARCGCRMGVNYGYNPTRKAMIPRYQCNARQLEGPGGCHISVAAIPIDEAVAKVAIAKLKPDILLLTADIHKEVAERKKDHLRYFELQLERAKHDEENAKYRYFNADATNRLVIAELESNWNRKLRELSEAQERYNEEVKKIDAASEQQTDIFLAKIASLDKDFETVWNSSSLENADKKRLLRCIVEDVTLKRSETEFLCTAQIRYQGGATEEIEVSITPRYVRIATPKNVLDFLRKESYSYSYTELTDMLNEQGYTRACKRPFTKKNVHRIMKDYGIPSMKQHYLDAGWLTIQDMAANLGMTVQGLKYRVAHGKYEGVWRVVEADRNTIMFYPDPEAKNVTYPAWNSSDNNDAP